MSEKRKKYTPAEKAKIALEAIKSELTLAQISSKYGAHATQINAWKKQALALFPDLFSDKNKSETTDYEAQLVELYEQIGRLKNAALSRCLIVMGLCSDLPRDIQRGDSNK